MKKLFFVPALAGVLCLAACGGGQSNSSTETAAETTSPSAADEAIASIPGIEAVELSNTIELEGNDQMKFDKTLFKVKVGETVKLNFKNAGSLPKEAMGHNVVVLLPGTDLASFGGEAVRAQAEEYIPATFASSIVAHTKLLGPGENDSIEFTLNDKGVYPFVCSFPGHYGIMQGNIVAE